MSGNNKLDKLACVPWNIKYYVRNSTPNVVIRSGSNGRFHYYLIKTVSFVVSQLVNYNMFDFYSRYKNIHTFKWLYGNKVGSQEDMNLNACSQPAGGLFFTGS